MARRKSKVSRKRSRRSGKRRSVAQKRFTKIAKLCSRKVKQGEESSYKDCMADKLRKE